MPGRRTVCPCESVRTFEENAHTRSSEKSAIPLETLKRLTLNGNVVTDTELCEDLVGTLRIARIYRIEKAEQFFALFSGQIQHSSRPPESLESGVSS